MLEFLSAHFKKLDEHKEFTANAVADVGSAISKTFKELKVHIQNSSEAMKNFTVDELELFFSIVNARGHGDDGVPLKSNNGIGIVNIKRRLELMYPGNYVLDINDKNENFEVTLKLKLMVHHQQ